MKYSIPEYSSFNNSDSNHSNLNKNKENNLFKSQGIPNYSTISSTSDNSDYKPLVSSFYSDIMGTTFSAIPNNASVLSKPYQPLHSMQNNSNGPKDSPTPTPTLPVRPTVPNQIQPGTTPPVNPSRPNVTIPTIPNMTSPDTPGTAVPTMPSTPGTVSPGPFRPVTTTTPANGTIPRITMPSIAPTIPGATVPNSTMPSSTLPRNTMPGATMPRSTMPNSTMPGITMPRSTMPNSTMPGITTPRSTMPNSTMPGITTPRSTMPNSTMPGITTPRSTMPNSTMPNTTLPNGMTMPTITSPVSPSSRLPKYQHAHHPNTVANNKYDYDFSGLGSSPSNGIFMANTNSSHVPFGVPMMPLYGYDNSEDADKDFNYMKQMYPLTARKMLTEIEEECDKLEYDGSCMFDEYPDRVYLSRIVDKIYKKCLHLNEVTSLRDNSSIEGKDVSSESLAVAPSKTTDEIYIENYKNSSTHKNNSLERDNKQWIRDMTEVLLYQEMLNRRRRYRSRKRWF